MDFFKLRGNSKCIMPYLSNSGMLEYDGEAFLPQQKCEAGYYAVILNKSI